MSGYYDYKNKILKSTDSEFDFLGLQGLYFYIFLGGCGLAFIILVLLGSLDVHWLAMAGIPGSVIALSYFGAKYISKKYGKGGYSSIVESNVPTNVQVRVNRDCYNRLS